MLHHYPGDCELIFLHAMAFLCGVSNDFHWDVGEYCPRGEADELFLKELSTIAPVAILLHNHLQPMHKDAVKTRSLFQASGLMLFCLNSYTTKRRGPGVHPVMLSCSLIEIHTGLTSECIFHEYASLQVSSETRFRLSEVSCVAELFFIGPK
ncbi:glutamate receptor-interacting protein 1 isoform X4 [Tachysurus ichikawai]